MIVAIILIAGLISVPVLNEYYFKIQNLSEIRREVRNRFNEINDLQAIGENQTARDSMEALIEYFSKRDDEVSIVATQLGMFQLASNYKQYAVSITDYLSAIRAYEKLLNKFPNTIIAEQLFLMIAKCHISIADIDRDRSEKHYKKAIEYLEKLEKNRPESLNFPKYKFVEFKPSKYFNIDKGKTKKLNRNLAKMLYTREDMLREMATDTTQVYAELLSDAVLEIGHCYSKLGMGEKAREQYNLLLNFFKESDLIDNAQKAIGESYEKEADVIKLKAAKTKDKSKKAQMLVDVKNLYIEAVETYLKFINVYIQSDLISKVYIQLGGVYFKLERSKDAYRTFAQAINSIKVIEEQAKVQLDIGTYYYDQGKWSDAIENYAKVLQNYSNTEFAANAQYLLARSYEAKGDTLEGLKAYNDVCDNFRSSSFYPASAFAISEYYINKKDYAKAQRYLRQSIQLFPQSPVAPQTQYKLGLIYKKIADDLDSSEAVMKYRLAIIEFERFLGSYDQESEWKEKTVLAMGECYMKIGQKEQARNTLEHVKTDQGIAKKYVILWGEGKEVTDSAIIKDYEHQLNKLTEDQAKAQIYLEIGRKLKGGELNLVDSAVNVLNYAIELAEDTITRMTAFGELADCYMKMGEYKRARSLFVDEILENPKCEEARKIQVSFKVAETYFRDKSYKEAIKHFTIFTEKNAEHSLAPPGTYFLGKSYSLLEDYKKAKEVFEKFFKHFKKAEMADNVALGYGEALEGEGEYKEAIAYMLDFLKKNPGIKSMPSFYFKIAEIYKKKLNQPDSAIQFYEKVLKFPDSFLFSSAAYYLGSLQAKAGKDDLAISAYEKVKKSDVEFFRAAQGEIGSLKAKTDPEGAILNYEKIESSSDDVADKVIARMGIGDVYAAQKKYMEAVASYQIIYEKYINAEKDLRAAAIIKIVDALNNAQKYNQIIEWTNRMISEFPDNKYTINAYYFRANAYYFLKQYGQARKAFNDVVKLDTATLAAISKFQRAECLLYMKKQDAAVKEFNMFIKQHPKNNLVANAMFHVANIDWGQEKYRKAKKIYLEILGRYPKFQAICWVKNYLAYCYDKEDSWRKAKKIYNEVLSRHCDREAKTFAKEQIRAINVRH
jgi:tetratricopeptide (TPR) repeat protein